MGCDFFYSGNLPDTTKQEKVVRFAASYYEKVSLFINPDPERKYLTKFDYQFLPEQDKRVCHYPFNFYGVIPFFEHELCEQGQFVFDRGSNGNFVRFMKLPRTYNLPPLEDCYEDMIQEVVVWSRGYARKSGIAFELIGTVTNGLSETCHVRNSSSLAFALLLTLIKLRWWPELDVKDDYHVFENLLGFLKDSRLHDVLRDESLDFDACWQMFEAEHERGNLHI